MYWYSILWFLSWIVFIYVSYLLAVYTIRKYEPLLEKPVKKGFRHRNATVSALKIPFA